MKLQFVTLDVFTSTRFAGNQLAIVSIPPELVNTITYDQKLQIAKEFNLAETVFILEPDSPTATNIPINIYLSSTEISFAGHPTIGTGIYLLTQQTRFQNVTSVNPRAGIIPLTYDADTQTISASIPHSTQLHPFTLPNPSPSLPTFPAQSPLFSIVPDMAFALVRLPDLSSLSLATRSYPDPSSLPSFRGTKYYVPLPSPSISPYVLRTRLHGSSHDPVEDAATGSASCALACYLCLTEIPVEKGEGPFEYHIIQGVEMGRKSDIWVKVQRATDGKGVQGVWLRGGAVGPVTRGEIEL